MKIRSENGTALVEFAIVLPLLLLILFGIIEFGFLLYNQAMMTNAAREGARTGIIIKTPRNSTTDITTIVNNYLSDYLVTFTTGTQPTPNTVVKVNGTVANPGSAGLQPAQDYLTVEVTYNYGFLIIPRFITNITGTKTLFASSTMRAE